MVHLIVVLLSFFGMLVFYENSLIGASFAFLLIISLLNFSIYLMKSYRDDLKNRAEKLREININDCKFICGKLKYTKGNNIPYLSEYEVLIVEDEVGIEYELISNNYRCINLIKNTDNYLKIYYHDIFIIAIDYNTN